jgi:hypothetical protein
MILVRKNFPRRETETAMSMEVMALPALKSDEPGDKRETFVDGSENAGLDCACVDEHATNMNTDLLTCSTAGQPLKQPRIQGLQGGSEG